MGILLWCLAASTRSVTLPYSSQGNDGRLGCSNQFILHGSFCYRYFGSAVRKPYHSAQKQCWRYQSTLVSLHSSREEDFVVSLAVNQSGFWIGLNDEDGPGVVHTEGYFKWSLGDEQFDATDPLSYCRWKPGEPANKRHLDCVKVDGAGWSMAPGGCAATRLPFVCKKKACLVGEEWDGRTCITVAMATPCPVMFLAVCLVVVVLVLVCCCCWPSSQNTLQTEELFPT